ncbi:SpaA isopeptide-forming pilin-related protein [Lactobacillus apis]|uniref:SpaA isopeptide-forming pilin-related protein n=1 Tax=Lactobacillus apis TaxID=303541 RepID=UPI0016500D07|nr:SpaA isopeptide-forming pilin-related protein [Lactobacillus apis]MBC6361691.1 LPXTG cell wall anchor domain-containing protein [Lactobacillus apis]
MKKIKKALFCFMSLMVLLQYMMPTVVFAVENQGDFQLTSLSVDKEEKDTIEAKISLSFKAQTEESQTLIFNEDATVKDVKIENETESTKVDYVINKNKIEMKIAPRTEGTIILSVSLDSSDLKDNNLILTNGMQTLKAPLKTHESESEEDSTKETEESEKESESADKAKEVKIKRDGGKQNIRDLLSKVGISPATIIDDVKVVYIDSNGHICTDLDSIPANASVEVNYSWSLPEELFGVIKEGDYFEFSLPDAIRVFPGTGPLIGNLGQYGSYEVFTDGRVRFEFNKNVETDHDIMGSFSYSTKFKRTEPGVVVIQTPNEDNAGPSKIRIRPNYDQAIDKSGHVNKVPNPTGIVWEVNINRPLSNMKDAELVDIVPAGTSLKSIEIYPETVDGTGAIVNIDRDHPLTEGVDYKRISSGSTETIKFIGKYAETHQAFHVVYTTMIDEDRKPEKGGNVEFKNRATLDDGTSSTSAEASVTAHYERPITKNGPFATGNDQIYKWIVRYNYNERKHPAGSTITDTMCDRLSLVKDSVKLFRISFTGAGDDEIIGDSLVEGSDYVIEESSSNAHRFIIRFLKEIDYPVRIDYQTKVNGYVDETTPISNSVITDIGDSDESEGTGHKDEIKGDANQQSIAKSIDGDIDYVTHEIPWQIQINKSGYLLKNWYLEDTFSKGQKLVDGSFKIIDLTEGKALSSDQYTFTKTDNGFKVEFEGELKNGTDHKYAITYKTNFDIAAIEGTGSEDSFIFKNTATANWMDKSGGSHSSTDWVEFDPLQRFKYNGNKIGVYNAINKKITWTVAVNYRHQELKNATITDVIEAPQDYVAGSAKLYEATVNSNGTYTLGDQVGADLVEPTTALPTLQVNLPENSNKMYVLVFETSLAGKVINQQYYNNRAVFTTEGVSHNLNSSISPAHFGELLDKDGAQDPDDSGYVKWNLTVNASQSTLNNVKIVDTPSANQFISKDGIVIYGTIVDSAGNIEKDSSTVLAEGTDYKVDIETNNATGAQVVTIEFLKQITTSYIVEYRSLVLLDKLVDTVANSASISGMNEQTITQGQAKEIVVTSTSGNATGSKGSIKLIKEDLSGKKRLSGVHLQLWTINEKLEKNKLVREGVTDSNGELEIGNLRVQEYLVVETEAPAGYTVSDELAKGKRIKVIKDEAGSTAKEVHIYNEPTKVTFRKVSEPDEKGSKLPLKGAEFKVLDSNGKVIEGYENVVSGDEGIVTIEGLVPGKYQIVETKAPTGYKLDDKPREFTVEKKDDGIIPPINLGDWENKRLNYKGSAKLLKTDNKGNPLAGAEFKVVDRDDNIVKSGLTSDANGVVLATSLAPGKYEFIETKAPEGYVINAEPVSFTISEEAKEDPAAVVTECELINYKGSAQLVKTDSKGNPLAGAEFKLVNKDGETVRENLVSSDTGIVFVSDLAPGKYEFVETKAPSGYVLNSTPAGFTIAETAQGEPAVVEAKLVNYKGSAQLIKTDSKGNPLAGAEFKVVNKDGEIVQENLVSSDKGIVFVTDLTPGKYQFIETKAPTGYVINSTPTDFTISESAEGEPTVVEAKLVNYKGSAQLVKTDSNGKPLAGAEFKVVDADGKTVLDKLVSSDKGIVSVTDLAPGKYQFIETKAPKGYYLNSKPVDFTIDKEAAGEPGLVKAGNLVNMEIKNDTPEWPSNPETPSAPDEPDSPDNPEKPGIPTDPGKPSIPDNPTTAKTVYDKRYNKKPRHDTGQKLPKTNYQNTLWLTILGLVILMLVAVIIYRNKKADQAE